MQRDASTAGENVIGKPFSGNANGPNSIPVPASAAGIDQLKFDIVFTCQKRCYKLMLLPNLKVYEY
jgi:hypothetical protein